MTLNEFVIAITSRPEFVNYLNADILIGDESGAIFTGVEINFCTNEDGTPDNLVEMQFINPVYPGDMQVEIED